MSDIALQVITDQVYGRQSLDIKVGATGLLADEGLETAVLISLFSDRRVDSEELPSFETDRRGWWGDLLSDVEDDQIGSKLWTLKREKTTVETRNKFRDFAIEALQWMIEDGIASDVIVDAEYIRRETILLTVEVVKPDGLSELFELIWNGQEVRR